MKFWVLHRQQRSFKDVQFRHLCRRCVEKRTRVSMPPTSRAQRSVDDTSIRGSNRFDRGSFSSVRCWMKTVTSAFADLRKNGKVLMNQRPRRPVVRALTKLAVPIRTKNMLWTLARVSLCPLRCRIGVFKRCTRSHVLIPRYSTIGQSSMHRVRYS